MTCLRCGSDLVDMLQEETRFCGSPWYACFDCGLLWNPKKKRSNDNSLFKEKSDNEI